MNKEGGAKLKSGRRMVLLDAQSFWPLKDDRVPQSFPLDVLEVEIYKQTVHHYSYP